jgi:hypothetical protein
MKTRKFLSAWFAVALAVLVKPDTTHAITNVFFNISQGTNLAASGTTSETISSAGYLFTVTRDKLFTGGGTNPIGRYLRVLWPAGMEVQAVTAGPNPRKARIDIKRQDGQTFAIKSFTNKLLANTAGAGGSFEIMPLLNGQDGAPDPFTYDATGVAGNQFTYNTPELTGFDTYQMGLYVDFAVMSLTVVDASLPPPVLDLIQLDASTVQLSWPTTATNYTLFVTTNLTGLGWTAITNDPVVDGDYFTVQLEITGDQRFYRLRK